MIIQELRNLIANINPEAVVFDDPSFDNSIIGISKSHKVQYNYATMVTELCEDDQMTDLDAIEFIDYNTIRALPYAGTYSPVIIYDEYEDIDPEENANDDLSDDDRETEFQLICENGEYVFLPIQTK